MVARDGTDERPLRVNLDESPMSAYRQSEPSVAEDLVRRRELNPSCQKRTKPKLRYRIRRPLLRQPRLAEAVEEGIEAARFFHNNFIMGSQAG